MLGTGRASRDGDRRVPWPLPGMDSVPKGGISLRSSAQDREYAENAGLGLPKSSLIRFVQSSG